MFLFLFISLLKIFSIVIPLLLAVAYFTIAERKIMGSIQRRKGPNVIGYLGLTQPLADGLKLFVKEMTLPTSANISIFVFAPCFTFILSLVSWSIIPFSDGIVLSDLNLGLLFVLSVSSLNVYGILFAGWSSNSKYAYLGALRSVAQMISYELSISFIFLTVATCSGSFNLTIIVLGQQKVWYILPLLPLFVGFYISILAETNRHPFDLPEAEAELVSGYNVEYSAISFAFFFISEYANMLLMSTLGATLFLGGWLPLYDCSLFHFVPGSIWLSLKIVLGVVFFILARSTLPRYRYDQLMFLGWKCFLPLTLSYFILTLSVLISFNWLPN